MGKLVSGEGRRGEDGRMRGGLERNGREEASNGRDEKEEEAKVMREGRKGTKRFVKGKTNEGQGG